MFDQIKNKNVLITGASGGIGSSIAELFFQYGANLGLHYNTNKNSLKDLLNGSLNDSENVFFYKKNLLNPDEINSLVENFMADF